MTCTKEELKSRVESTAVGRGGGRLYSKELRRDILEYALAAKAVGRSSQKVADELELKGWTLHRWLQNERRAQVSSAARFIEVAPRRRGRPPKAAMADAPAMKVKSEFSVKCPSGFEVRVPESFEESSLRRLLRAMKGL